MSLRRSLMIGLAMVIGWIIAARQQHAANSKWNGPGGSGIDGKACPPKTGQGLLFHSNSNNRQQEKNKNVGGTIYSNEFDPRNIISKPPLFPHCELMKLVQQQQFHHRQPQCFDGEEYATHIYPKQQLLSFKHNKSSINNDAVVKIMHIASPTNCLPKSAIQLLQAFTNHYYASSSSKIAIYIHSQQARDAFLLQQRQRLVGNVFPELNEGILCGMAKIKFVVRKILDRITISDSSSPTTVTGETEQQQQKKQQQRKDAIANEIAELSKRDIWRYLILWEYGGTLFDLEVLQSLFNTPSSSDATAKSTTTDAVVNSKLIKDAIQWFDSSSNNGGDAFVTIIENEGGKSNVALTGILGASQPNHPLWYFCVKWALRSMREDNYMVSGGSPFFRVFNALGRNTDLASLNASLTVILGDDWETKSKQYNIAHKCVVDGTRSIRFLNGRGGDSDGLLFPKSLALPMQDVIPIVKRYIKNKSELPDDDNIIIKSFQNMEELIEMKHEEDKNFVSKPDPIIFSCVEYSLQVYTNNAEMQQE